MFWAKRRFEWADYAPYQDRIEKLLMSNPTQYREFMMFSIEQKVGLSDVYVGVPTQAFLAVFDDFEPVAERETCRRWWIRCWWRMQTHSKSGSSSSTTSGDVYE